MRQSALFGLCLIVALTACKTRKPLETPREAEELPRDAIVSKLGEVLPTADYVYCMHPKASLKPSEIKAWSVKGESLQIEYGKATILVLNYDQIRDVKLELAGRYYTVHVFTTVLPEKDHFQFLWKAEDKAKSAADLLGALRKK